MLHRYGENPPLAVSVNVYGAPTTPLDIPFVVICSGRYGSMVRMLTALLVLSSTLVAATTTRVLDTTTGAMNKPLLVMAPELAVQITAELLVFLTVAAKCSFEPEARIKLLGEIVSCTWADCTAGPPAALETPPQPTEIRTVRSTGTITNLLTRKWK